jgi:octaprenyl-diphosphate synthase
MGVRHLSNVVPLKDERASSTKGLEALRRHVNADLEGVNAVILDKMQSDVALIPQLASHIIAAGGKRLRPILTLASARLCGYGGDRHIALAACVEFIHTATLLHDDVVDESDLRRGSATANAVFGNQASVLVGDFLFSRAFELMVADGSLEVLGILSRASAIIAEGEVMQLITTNDTETTEDAYLDVISSKTAALFAAACRVGGVVAEAGRTEVEALDSYGRNLGVAFQLIDDALDYASREATLGKAIGDDFKEGKITLPVVLAFRRGTDDERAFWRRCLEEMDQRGDDLGVAQELMRRHNALADTVERARHYGDKARDALGLFPESPLKTALSDAIQFTVDRAF